MPLDGLDIRHLVKNYLDARGVKNPDFAENLPGTDWLNRFMKRHQLTQTVSDNIKSSQAEITKKTMIDFFEHREHHIH